MINAKKYVDKVLEFVTCTIFALMVAVTAWQVISRFILNNPSTATEEFVRFGLIWLSMLAAAYVVGRKGHIAITLLSEKLKDGKKLVLGLVIQSGFLLFAAVIMIYGGSRAVSFTMAQISPSLGVPMGLVYLSLPVSGVLILFYSSINILELLRERKEGAPIETQVESQININ